jgi:hypothetical protein
MPGFAVNGSPLIVAIHDNEVEDAVAINVGDE